RLIEAMFVDTYDAEREVGRQLALDRQRKLIDARLLFVGIEGSIARQRAGVPDDAPDEIGSVWIEVDFTRIVAAVGVQIAPPVGGHSGDEGVELEDFVLGAHMVVPAPPSLEN